MGDNRVRVTGTQLLRKGLPTVFNRIIPRTKRWGPPRWRGAHAVRVGPTAERWAEERRPSSQGPQSVLVVVVLIIVIIAVVVVVVILVVLAVVVVLIIIVVLIVAI